MKKTLVAAAVAVLALAAAGCGGDESPTASATDEWADGFCTAITTWTDSLGNVRDGFTSGASVPLAGWARGCRKRRPELDRHTGRGSSKDSARQTRSRARPWRDSVDDLSTTLETEVANIESAAQGASGLSGIPSAITSITASLSAMSTAFSSTLQSIESADSEDELRTALEDSPACADITSFGRSTKEGSKPWV